MVLTKPLQITDDVYEQLKTFRDAQGLTSFSNAIQTLLNFREEKEVEVSAFIDAHVKPKMDAYFADKITEAEKELDKVIAKRVEG